jgi:hypothetical protein
MSQLGHVIALMHGARERYSMLGLRIHVRVDIGLLRGRTVFGGASPEDFDPVGIEEADVRAWVASPWRWRVQFRSPEHSFEQGRNGDRWWSTDPNGISTGIAARTCVESPLAELQPFEELWDPALLIGELWLEPQGRTRVANRDAIVVRGIPRPTPRPDGNEFILLNFPGGDEHELVVDEELGIVLRFRSFSTGAEMVREETLAVDGDASVPDRFFDDQDGP